MHSIKLYAAIIAVGGFVFGMQGLDALSPGDDCTRLTGEYRSDHVEGLPQDTNSLFAGSGKCGGCHGYDANMVVSVDSNGVDVNVVDDWRTTMMANSAKDPFWRAKVSHEVLVNPGHQSELENTCTSCHAPMGHFEALRDGTGPYSMAALLSDSLALDGVSCGACHQQDPNMVGDFFSGQLFYDTLRRVYGQYPGPFASPMQLIGFPAAYHEYISESEACAGCHTLITSTVDLGGTPTGNQFVEQATYHEWLNSIYPDSSESCQSCHMETVEDPVILAIDYEFVGGRTPFERHFFVGANAFMLELMKNNADSLGIYPTPELFDSTIERTIDMLQNRSLDLLLTETNRTIDTVFIDLELMNKAGHKFPSGYPSRRAFIRMVVMDANSDTLFASGVWDQTNEVIGHGPNYEPHYNTIRAEDEVQIYEMVMADVNGDKTTVLERADAPIKDNRLAPKGFTTGHFAYDTTLIAGNAVNDSDFNWSGTTEGTGGDIVHYHVPLNGYSGDLNVIAEVYYQSSPPAWMDEMFSFNSPAIDKFRDMYNAADGTPILVSRASYGNMWIGVQEPVVRPLKVFPNPTQSGRFTIEASGVTVDQLEIFDLSGKLVRTYQQNADRSQFELPTTAGVYFLLITTSDGKQFKHKIIRSR